MADMPSPASPMPQSGMPGAGAPPAPPVGGSPAIQPSPNRGFQEAGKQKLAIANKMLMDALPMFGASSEEGQVLLKCLKELGKIAQPGDVSQSGQMSQLQSAMMKAVQGAQQQRALQGGAGAPPGGAPGGAPGAAPPAMRAA